MDSHVFSPQLEPRGHGAEPILLENPPQQPLTRDGRLHGRLQPGAEAMRLCAFVDVRLWTPTT